MSISIVIQGPLDKQFLESVEEYKKHGPVILSTYTHSRLDKNYNITEIYSPLPNLNCYNANNLYYQAFSTLAGLRLIKTEFVIKVRTNESYSDISKFIIKVFDNPNKIITNNVAFPRTKVQPLHPSDHMIGGRTEILTKSFEDVKHSCENLPNLSTNLFGGQIGYGWMGHLLAEQILCLSFLKNLGFDIELLKTKHDPDYVTQIMKTYFDVVPVEDLGDVVHSISYNGGRNYRKNGEGLYGYPHESIRNIEEL